MRDSRHHAYFAAHGYAGVRVDLRGSGDSDGLLTDEYLPLEQEDAVEVIAWLAEQEWCTGAVGMLGISWGGFNGLQIREWGFFETPIYLTATMAVGRVYDGAVAAAVAAEEAVLNALWHAETVHGREGRVAEALPHDAVLAALGA